MMTRVHRPRRLFFPNLPTAWSVVGLLLQSAPLTLSQTTPEKAGSDLAARVRSLLPQSAGTNSALMRVRPARPALPYQIPLRIAVFPTPEGWCTLYEADPGPQRPAVRLWIEHVRDHRPRYFVAEKDHSGAWPAQPEPLEPARRMLGFAGSDFAPADLSLEFLFWPHHRLLRSEMRRGQFCDLIESSTPDSPPDGYCRVRAWFDRDTGGLVYAEGLDAQGRVVKEFLPRRFRKIDGQWEVTELEMIHRLAGSRTVLVLNLTPADPGQ